MRLLEPVTNIKGIGKRKAENLKQLNIETVNDLLHHFPFRYEDLSPKLVSDLLDGEKAAVLGLVATPPVVNYFRNSKGNRLRFMLKQQNEVIAVVFFNQPYLKKRIKLGSVILVFGRYDKAAAQLNGERILDWDFGVDYEANQGVYRLVSGLTQKQMKSWIKTAWDSYGDLIPELLPAKIRQFYDLPSHHDAISSLHFPEEGKDTKQAVWQVKYQECFLHFLLLFALRTLKDQAKPGQELLYDNQELKAFVTQIPFNLTTGQKAVSNTICRDLRSNHAMYRLLQGDVGSGKTIVAFIAAKATILGGGQVALMVPTEILSEQHFTSALAYFDKSEVALLTSSTPPKERKDLLRRLETGELKFIIGTHALLQADIIFQQLALAMIDEQHRFGVKQRETLIHKGEGVNVLSMTATPIPRTLELTQYGDMDISKLTELPSGRQPVKTTWLTNDLEDQALEAILRELAKGQQVYIICPLIEASETEEAKNAQDIFVHYRRLLPKQYVLGLLHGRLSNEEKDQAMRAFKDNQSQVLVSTTVIEVGVDVPNASLMLILNAERFGLAQLHQLRGRVGRGSVQGHCILLADPKSEEGELRMQLMTQSNDGFYLSEADLRLRGSGDVFGTRQSGLPNFNLVNPIEDQEILVKAREDAYQYQHLLFNQAVSDPQLEEWLEGAVNQVYKVQAEKGGSL